VDNGPQAYARLFYFDTARAARGKQRCMQTSLPRVGRDGGGAFVDVGGWLRERMGPDTASHLLVEASVGRLSTRAVGGSSVRESPLRERRCTQLAVWRGGRTAGRWRGARGRRGRERATASTRQRDVVETLQRSHANWPAKLVVTAGSAGVHCPEKGPAADGGSKPTSGGRY